MKTSHVARAGVLLGLVLFAADAQAQFRGARDYTKRIAPQLPPPSAPAQPGQPAAAPAAPAKPVDPAVLKADKDEAAKKLVAYQKERAEAGSESCQLALGVRYMTGDGVERDLALSRKWLEASAKQGNDQAPKRLEELKKLEAEAKKTGETNKSPVDLKKGDKPAPAAK